MQKKSLAKKFARSVGIVLLMAVLYLANTVFGNPLSYLLARGSAKKYLAEKYPTLELTIEEVGYGFEDGVYGISVTCASSPDTHFALQCSKLGKITHDSYDTAVAQKGNTLRRLEQSFDRDAAALLDELPYEYGFHGGELIGFEPDKAAAISALVLDMPYERSLLELFRTEIYADIYREAPSFPELLNILHEFDAHLAKSGIQNIVRYCVTLEDARPADSSMPASVGVLYFDRELLYSDNALELMEENWRIANIVE